VKKLVQGGYDTAAAILEKHTEALVNVAEALLIREIGPRGVLGLGVAMLALALANGLHRTSRVGGHDLYYWFFSHSGVPEGSFVCARLANSCACFTSPSRK